jgi:hypothetical protein
VTVLGAAADTYIEQGTEGTNDHGGSDHLDVDTKPAGIAYLEFDLRDVPGAVTRATLTLHCLNATSDGGTVYPVADSSWIEGAGNDTPGPGLTWVQVDTNGDSIVDARDASPFVPDFSRPIATLGNVTVGQTVTVDLTAAVQSGPGLYTFAIRNGDSNGATYASREYATAVSRPLLQVESVGCRSDAECDDGVFCNGAETCHGGSCVSGPPPACADVVDCTVDRCDEAARACVRTPDDAACDDGSTCTTDTCDATSGCRHTDNGSCQPQTIDLDVAADTYVEADTESTWDHGASDHLDVDTQPAGIAYLALDLRGITRPVGHATLTLHCTNASSDGGTVYPVGDSSWVEGTAGGVDASSKTGPGLKWTDVDTNADGVVDARDTSPWTPDATHPIATIGAVASGQTVTVDVTAALQAGPRLYTLALRNGSANGVTYSSRQHPTVGFRPWLRLVLLPTG